MLFRIFVLLSFAAIFNGAQATPVIVTTDTLAEVLIEKKYTSPAGAVAINRSQISAEISARITSFNVQTGDIVNPGDVLARLDCRSNKNALSSSQAVLDSLQAQVQLAQQQLRRAKALQTAGNLSAEVRDQRVAEFDIARANLKGQSVIIASAKLSVERCSITAPFRAAVTSRLVGEGTLATPGLPLVEIVGLDEVEISAQIPVDLVSSVKASKSLLFVNHDSSTPVKIRNISPVINAATGNRELRLATAKALTPGTSGRLEWYSLPLLPANLLTRRGDDLGVFIVKKTGSRYYARFVSLPAALEGRPAFVDLPAASRVIIKGRHKLSPGDEINLVIDD